MDTETELDELERALDDLLEVHSRVRRKRFRRFLCELLAYFAVVALCLLAIAYLA